MKIKGKGGFTLVELMIVVIIVGILAASAVPIFRGQMRRAHAAEGIAVLGAIRSAQRIHYTEFETFRATTDILVDLGLDTAHNHSWRNAAFVVEGHPMVGDIATGFIATATGATATDAPGRDRIYGMVLTMNHEGVVTRTVNGVSF